MKYNTYLFCVKNNLHSMVIPIILFCLSFSCFAGERIDCDIEYENAKKEFKGKGAIQRYKNAYVIIKKLIKNYDYNPIVGVLKIKKDEFEDAFGEPDAETHNSNNDKSIYVYYCGRDDKGMYNELFISKNDINDMYRFYWDKTLLASGLSRWDFFDKNKAMYEKAL